jgi:hypothetical protein
MNKVLQIQAGRSSERPASFSGALFYRARAEDGADCLTTFDRRTIMIARSVAGLPCKIRLTTDQYLAVAVVEREARHVVRLALRDAGLSIDLAEMESLAAAEEYRDELADFLDLPPLMLAGAGAPRADDDEAEAMLVPPARRDRALRARRPRFLLRRKMGGAVSVRKLEAREIVARN